MARFEQRPKVSVEITVTLTEDEAAAIAVMASYGVDTFVKAFYEKLGQSYMEPHEKGLRSFLETAPGPINAILARAKRAREEFERKQCVPQ